MKKTMTMVTALVMAACMASCGSVNEKATNTAAKNDTSARAPIPVLLLFISPFSSAEPLLPRR